MNGITSLSVNTLSMCLLPGELRKEMAQRTINERAFLALYDLIAGIAQHSLLAFQKGQLKLLDPNPGDGSCQLRALELYIAKCDGNVKQECFSLLEKARRISTCVKALRTSQKRAEHLQLRQELFAVLAEGQTGNITLSRRMEFILLCGFLAKLRRAYEIKENGIVMTKTDSCFLSHFSKKIEADVSREYRSKIVERAQVNLTLLSMEAIRESAQRIKPSDESRFTCQMLSPLHTKLIASGKFEPKAFGCQFYGTKAVMQYLREQKAIIALKSIVPKGKPISLVFLQGLGEGGDYQIKSFAEMQKLDPTTPIVVVEAVFGASKASVVGRVQAIGFIRLMLVDSSMQPQYHAESKIEEVNDERARGEILAYRQMAEELLGKNYSFLQVDHMYANTLEKELELCQPLEDA